MPSCGGTCPAQALHNKTGFSLEDEREDKVPLLLKELAFAQ